MSRQLIITLLVFVVALGSGIVVGANFPRQEASPHQPGRSWLADQLKLTSEQRKQIESIWQEMLPEGQGRPGERGGLSRHGEGRRQLVKERDEAIAALIPAEKKVEYEKVLARFDQQVAELSRERMEAFQKAVEQTKQVLNPEQRVKYEELLKKGAFGPRRPGTNPSATQPAVK